MWMGKSHVTLTFDRSIVQGLESLVSRVPYLCPSPLRGKGLIAPVDYHLTVYYGFAPSACAADVQEWLDAHFRGGLCLRTVGLMSHSVSGLRCFGVEVKSFGLLQLNHWLGQHPLALPSIFKVYRPHITLGYFQPSFNLGLLAPQDSPFGPGGELRGLLSDQRFDCWFVDGVSRCSTRLHLSGG